MKLTWTQTLTISLHLKAVDEFMEKTFHRCIPKRKRNEMAKDYPKPSSQAVLVPKLDHDIKGALGKEVPDKSNAQLAKIQLDLSGPDSQVPAGEIVTII